MALLDRVSDRERYLLRAKYYRMVEKTTEAIPVLEALLKTRGADQWQQLLTEAGVPCGPINDLAQGFALADSLGLNPIIEIEGLRQVANPVHYDATPATYRAAPPRVDEDRAAVLDLLRDRA